MHCIDPAVESLESIIIGAGGGGSRSKDPNPVVHQPLRRGTPLVVHTSQCARVLIRRKRVFVRAFPPRRTAGRADREGGHQQSWPHCAAAIPPRAFRLPVHRPRELHDDPAKGEQCEEDARPAKEPGAVAGPRQPSMLGAPNPGPQATDEEVDDQRKPGAEEVQEQVHANES